MASPVSALVKCKSNCTRASTITFTKSKTLLFTHFTNGVYTKGTRAHTQKEMIRGGLSERARVGAHGTMAPCAQRSSPPISTHYKDGTYTKGTRHRPHHPFFSFFSNGKSPFSVGQIQIELHTNFDHLLHATQTASISTLHRRFIYKGDTRTHARRTDPRVVLRAYRELP